MQDARHFYSTFIIDIIINIIIIIAAWQMVVVV
jgi:hypothetical protein